MAKRQINSQFSVDEETFIIEQFAILKSPKAVKNVFAKSGNVKPRLSKNSSTALLQTSA